MYHFPDIDETNKMLDEIAEEIPQEFFKELNEGIILLSEYKLHPVSRDRDKLYIMGEYRKSITGRNIAIYYGSFERVYCGIPKEKLRQILKDTLLHEFTHHLESLAGERGLEVKDAQKLRKYKEK
jgi:predicted Zn-dependent protease with MMP-like domain